MKSVTLIDASPKVNEKSVSNYLIEKIAACLDDMVTEKKIINIRQSFKRHEILENYKYLIKADAVIIAFPLYIFCIPGILMRFLQDYYRFYLENKIDSGSPKIYAIVNSGFPEPEINFEAVRVIESFCRHVNANFRFGVQIGCGGMLPGAEGKPIMKKVEQKLNKAFCLIAEDIQNDNFKKIDNFLIDTMNFPKWIFGILMNKFGWPSRARSNGLKRKDLYRKPYMVK